MSIANSLATVFLSMSLVALAGAMSRLGTIQLPTLLFIFFFILFRIKGYLDDVSYFRSANFKGRFFALSFFLGILAWFFWVAAAVTLSDLLAACRYILFAILVSTAWIGVDWLDRGWQRQFQTWLIVNTLYVTSLIAILYILVTPSSAVLTGTFVAWIIICFVDLRRTGSIENLATN